MRSFQLEGHFLFKKGLKLRFRFRSVKYHPQSIHTLTGTVWLHLLSSVLNSRLFRCSLPLCPDNNREPPEPIESVSYNTWPTLIKFRSLILFNLWMVAMFTAVFCAITGRTSPFLTVYVATPVFVPGFADKGCAMLMCEPRLL